MAVWKGLICNLLMYNILYINILYSQKPFSPSLLTAGLLCVCFEWEKMQERDSLSLFIPHSILLALEHLGTYIV